jgi:SAM-dependent methyltransferase
MRFSRAPNRSAILKRKILTHSIEEFDAFYSSTPPWDIGRAQPELLRLAESGVLRGRVLDVGCGTGEHALMAAKFGSEAVGIDAAPSAIAIAQGKARARRIPARFLVWNALSLTSLGEQFDIVLDCGLFHVFTDEERPLFVQNLAAVTRPGGRYFMLCFSERQPGGTGPRRVTQADIRANFERGWTVDSIEPAIIEVTTGPGVLAWLASITRTARHS